jgi:hypothetical protein
MEAMTILELVKWFEDTEEDIKIFEDDIREKQKYLDLCIKRREFLLKTITSMSHESRESN